MTEVKLPLEVKYIIEELNRTGFEAYAVGGCIRDSLLGRKPNDWDITTSAKAEDVMNLFDKTIPTGIKHGTVTVILNEKNYEVTTFRIDGEYKDNRRPSEVIFVNDIKEDLARRDFTINALAYNEKVGLVDYYFGVNDLRSKIIRAVGNPSKRFNEDALRMIRAVRFSAQLGFDIEKNTLLAIKENYRLLQSISIERIRSEFDKLILANPGHIRLLSDVGLLEVILPELNASEGLIKSINLAINVPKKLHLLLTMLLYNICKVNNISEKILKRMKYDNKTIKQVSVMISYLNVDINDKISIKKVLNKIGEEAFEDLLVLKKSYILNSNTLKKEEIMNLEKIEKEFIEIKMNKECFSIKSLNINGNDLIELGINKGSEIGKVLNYLLEIVIKDPNLNSKKYLLEKVKEDINK